MRHVRPALERGNLETKDEGVRDANLVDESIQREAKDAALLCVCMVCQKIWTKEEGY